MATIWTTMEKTEKGRFEETGFHTSEPEQWFRCINVEDPEDFIAHMRSFRNIPLNPLSREEYEGLCEQYDVSPLKDSELGFYGVTSSSMGTNNYRLHTSPDTRSIAVANKINELRYRAIMRSELA
ncbi:hypothetical protein [Desulfuromonas acetoxidans]|uniref:Uncharacterized protein n=1 Tax=Desulfuromonas acetoxidans (strain DSM 684 / 11070) TaxID=281689 RepID=Q1K2M5_DESA6|nr:hypothetical protein [Desulfuromonas acetoxidans]EAT16856.1 hypothetical protein Dace_2108 [Desulfuromonas acetoxidans DSM 684]MBF0644591.1 hypothetical protein [Desulfuromonas acetoxidans]NVD23802.1 hypothetical protein [Desulfuromonas acetoxidans]NVE15801.1 hypothetical protein [Desulfuromonas acetoxidans]